MNSAIKFSLLILVVSAFDGVLGVPTLRRDPDEFFNTTQLIQSKGYPAEEHTVTTPDGYILTIFRIPNPGRPAVFLQHGLMDASHTFVMNFRNQSLGFVLWDAGYDVWMGNVRGNTYGLRHIKLKPDDVAFWNFSWPEMAEKDLPSMVDYAVKTSGQKDLIYIGHSQGTLIAFSQLGINTRLAAQIKLFIALGPIVHVEYVKSPIRLFADLGRNSTQLIWYKILGEKDFLPSSALVEWMADTFCNVEIMDKIFCENILFAFCGPSTHMNASRVAVYSTHSPAGTSVKDMIHFSQMIVSGKFQKYDFGSDKENIVHYDQPTPPLYDLTGIKTPVALYSSSNDWLSVQDDIVFIRKNLPTIVDDYMVNGWNHLDFVWAVDTIPLLYERMLNLMKKYQ